MRLGLHELSTKSCSPWMSVIDIGASKLGVIDVNHAQMM